MLLLYGLGGLLGLIILYLAIIIFMPGFKVPEQPFSELQIGSDLLAADSLPFREDVSFDVNGMQIRGWLYLPDSTVAAVPCIILNTGFGGTKDMLLENYALRFREAGFASLAFDYRHFGESEGEPRQLFTIQDQLDDCRAAIAFVRQRPEIDARRIAVWGTSAGGGYGLVMAAEDADIACVYAQCAGLDSQEDGKLALERNGWGYFLRLFMHAQRDKGRSRFGLPPHKIPIVGDTGTLAMVVAPGAKEGYASVAGSSFTNEVCARAILTTGGYNPIKKAPEVKCPVMIQICEHDNLVSQNSALNTARALGERAEVRSYPIGHFDIYIGAAFEQSIADQLDFFNRHLMASSP